MEGRSGWLKALLFGILPIGAVHAQECDGTRYFDPSLFGVQQTEAVLFGSNTAVGGGEQPLYMDVYEPMGDQLQQRPVVIVAFGGSFIAGSRDDVALICIQLAKRGFVAIAPDYRTGLFVPSGQGTMLAVMRATHDLKAAVRYLRRSVAEESTPWRIDPDRIIVGERRRDANLAESDAFVDLTPPWRRASMTELIEEHAGLSVDVSMPIDELRADCVQFALLRRALVETRQRLTATFTESGAELHLMPQRVAQPA